MLSCSSSSIRRSYARTSGVMAARVFHAGRSGSASAAWMMASRSCGGSCVRGVDVDDTSVWVEWNQSESISAPRRPPWTALWDDGKGYMHTAPTPCFRPHCGASNPFFPRTHLGRLLLVHAELLERALQLVLQEAVLGAEGRHLVVVIAPRGRQPRCRGAAVHPQHTPGARARGSRLEARGSRACVADDDGACCRRRV